MCVGTSQNAGAGRAAHRCCDERVHKVGSFLAKNFASLLHYLRRSKRSVQIICHNKNYVGSPRRSWTASKSVLWFACGRHGITQHEQRENCQAFHHFPPNQRQRWWGVDCLIVVLECQAIPKKNLKRMCWKSINQHHWSIHFKVPMVSGTSIVGMKLLLNPMMIEMICKIISNKTDNSRRDSVRN